MVGAVTATREQATLDRDKFMAEMAETVETVELVLLAL